MAKFAGSKIISKNKNKAILTNFYKSISSIRSAEEASGLFKDLLGQQEIEMIAKRLKVAEYLLAGQTYEFIQKKISVSTQTIARIQNWMQNSGQACRILIHRVNKNKKFKIKKEKPEKLSQIKKKYPIFLWPQQILQSLLQKSTLQEKQEMLNILKKINKKHYKDLNKLIVKSLKKSEAKK